jgi:sugar phosphate permease
VTFIKIRPHRRKFSNSDSVEHKFFFKFVLKNSEKTLSYFKSLDFETVKLFLYITRIEQNNWLTFFITENIDKSNRNFCYLLLNS